MKEQPDKSLAVRRSVRSLFIANVMTFAVVGLSYVAYSRLLSTAEFGVYAAALAISSFGILVLDGGLKTSIIKRSSEFTIQEESAILVVLVGLSVVLATFLFLLQSPIGNQWPAARNDYAFLACFGAIFLLTYPWMVVPTALLERRLAYNKVAWAEAGGIVLERSTPALFLLAFHTGLNSFIFGLLIGRVWRLLVLLQAHPPLRRVPSWPEVLRIWPLIQEGLWIQLANASSLIRDSLHILLIGPLFGQQWIGFYAWGLQLCQVTSQAMVATAARVSVSTFSREENTQVVWRSCRQQIRLLVILTGPILLTSLLIIPDLDRLLFAGKWQSAIALLPLLFARMIPGVATTPLGSFLLVQLGARPYAWANILWSAIEVLSASGLVILLGPTGLAWSWAVCVWGGFALFTAFLRQVIPELPRDALVDLLWRPSLVISIVATSVTMLFQWHDTFTVSICLVVFYCGVSFFSERDDLVALFRLKKVWR